MVASVEIALVAALGNLVGLGGWLAWRRLDPTAQVGSFGWYSTDLWVPLTTQATVFAVLVALAVVVGLFGAHAGVARSLETRRERSARGASAWRVVPLSVGLSLLAWSWVASGWSGHFLTWLVPFGSGLLGTAFGLVLVVPFAASALGGLLGGSWRPSALLAGARLRHDPTVAGRVVSTLAIVLFAAGIAQVVLINVNTAYATSEDQIGSVLTMTAYGTTSDQAAYASTSDIDIALPSFPLGDGVTAVAATCAELRVATGHEVVGCRDGVAHRVASIRTEAPGVAGPRPTVVYRDRVGHRSIRRWPLPAVRPPPATSISPRPP